MNEKKSNQGSGGLKEGKVVVWEDSKRKLEISEKACCNYIMLPILIIILALFLRRPVQALLTGDIIKLRPGKGITYRGRRMNLNNQWEYISRRMKRIPYDRLTTFWAEGRYYHCLEYTNAGIRLGFSSTKPMLRPSNRLAFIWMDSKNVRWRSVWIHHSSVEHLLLKHPWLVPVYGNESVWFPEIGTLFLVDSTYNITDIMLREPDDEYVAEAEEDSSVFQ